MAQLMQKPQLIRNVGLIGHLHHGKTLMSDLLIQATREEPDSIKNGSKDPKYTDCRLDEINRKISVKCAPF